MKRFAKIVSVIVAIALIATVAACFVACNPNESDQSLRFAAPEGTPALAIARLAADNGTIDGQKIGYAVVAPENIASEMSSKKADLVIMPTNAGANLIRQGADYKLVSIAVDGSLYMIGKKEGSNELTFDDVKGKKVACIGQTGVPGLVFRYVMANNGVELITSGTPTANQVFVQYVKDGPAAKELLADKSVDFAVVGEPAATAQKGALSLNAEMDMQAEYKKISEANGENYPQAGLFVRTALYGNESFMNALFEALAASKEWVLDKDNANAVQAFVKANLYEAAVFPAPSIERCALNAEKLDEQAKNRVIAFLKNVMPKDSSGNTIDWDAAAELIF